MDSPVAYRSAHRLTVGHEHWNRAATSAIGTCWSITSRATVSRARGVRAALAWDTRASCEQSGYLGSSTPPREALVRYQIRSTHRTHSTNVSGQYT